MSARETAELLLAGRLVQAEGYERVLAAEACPLR